MKTHVYTRGEPENPAVILIHGLLGASRNLLRVQEHLAGAGYFVLAYDQRGHGHAPHFPVEQYKLLDLSNDLLEIIEEYKLSKVHLVGHSMGGRVCMLTASRPEAKVKIKTIQMLDVGPKINEAARSALYSIITPLPYNFDTKSQAHELLKKIIPLQGQHKVMFEQFLLSNLRSRDHHFEWMFDLDGIRTTLLPDLASNYFSAWKAITCPIHVVRGEQSLHFTESDIDAMKPDQPHLEISRIPYAGHWIHADNLKDTNSVILEFLKHHENS